MIEKFILTITCDEDGIRYTIKSDTPVRTQAAIGVLEMCKLMTFENRIQNACGENTESKSRKNILAMIESVRNIHLAKGPLSVRTVTALHKNGICMLEDLLRYSKKVLMRLRGVGKKSIEEITGYVKSHGYELESLAPIWFDAGCLYARHSRSGHIHKCDNEEELKNWIACENNRILKEEIES